MTDRLTQEEAARHAGIHIQSIQDHKQERIVYYMLRDAGFNPSGMTSSQLRYLYRLRHWPTTLIYVASYVREHDGPPVSILGKIVTRLANHDGHQIALFELIIREAERTGDWWSAIKRPRASDGLPI